MGLSISAVCCFPCGTGNSKLGANFSNINDIGELLRALKNEYNRVKIMTSSLSENFFRMKSISNDNVIKDNPKLNYKDDYYELSYYLNLSAVLLKLINVSSEVDSSEIKKKEAKSKKDMEKKDITRVGETKGFDGLASRTRITIKGLPG